MLPPEPQPQPFSDFFSNELCANMSRFLPALINLPKVKPCSLPSLAAAPHSPRTKSASGACLSCDYFSRHCRVIGTSFWVPQEAKIWAQEYVPAPTCQPQEQHMWEISNGEPRLCLQHQSLQAVWTTLCHGRHWVCLQRRDKELRSPEPVWISHLDSPA